jgi:hypothetical protein
LNQGRVIVLSPKINVKIPKLSFIQNILVCVLLSGLQVLIIFNTSIIYIPIFFTLIFSFLYGMLEPKKGWVLSFCQITLLTGSYWGLSYLGVKAQNHDTAIFATHISLFPSFVAAFLGSFIVRL